MQYLDYDENAVEKARKTYRPGSKWTFSQMKLEDGDQKWESFKRILDLKQSKTATLTDPNVPTHVPEPSTDVPTLLTAKTNKVVDVVGVVKDLEPTKDCKPPKQGKYTNLWLATLEGSVRTHLKGVPKIALKNGDVLQIDEAFLCVEQGLVRLVANWEKGVFHEAPMHPMGRRLAEDSDAILNTEVPLISAPFVPLAQPISPYGEAHLVPLCTLAATTDPIGLRGEKPVLYEVWGASVHSVTAQELVWPKCKCGSKYSAKDKTCAKKCTDAIQDGFCVYGTIELSDWTGKLKATIEEEPALTLFNVKSVAQLRQVGTKPRRTRAIVRISARFPQDDETAAEV